MKQPLAFLFCKVGLDIGDRILAACRVDHDLKARGAECAEGANDLMPDRPSLVKQDPFLLIDGKIGVDREGLDPLSARKILHDRKAVDEAETLTDRNDWPYPAYSEMLYGIE